MISSTTGNSTLVRVTTGLSGKKFIVVVVDVVVLSVVDVVVVVLSVVDVSVVGVILNIEFFVDMR